jgi:hypothetical protein
MLICIKQIAHDVQNNLHFTNRRASNSAYYSTRMELNNTNICIRFAMLLQYMHGRTFVDF